MYTIYLHQISKAGTRENAALSLADEQVEGRMDGNYLEHLAQHLDQVLYAHCGWLAEDRHWEVVYYPEPLPYKYLGEDPDECL